MTHKRLVFNKKQKVELEEYNIPVLKNNQIGIKNLYSLMSTGTENIVYNCDFAPGTHWDAWVKYPFYPGYACVGRIVDIGNKVENNLLGKNVLVRSSHGTYAITEKENVYLLPDNINIKESTWFSYAKICFMGLLASELKIGDNILIIGAGPIGQILARWVLISGPKNVVVVDNTQFRLDLLNNNNIDTLKAILDKDILYKKFNCEDEFDIVFDCTGNHFVLPKALEIVKKYGKVVILGDTGKPELQHLNSNIITKGIKIIGAHDSHTREKYSEKWIINFFLKLVLQKRFDLSGLITHEYYGDEADKAYKLTNNLRENTLGILFNWNNL